MSSSPKPLALEPQHTSNVTADPAIAGGSAEQMNGGRLVTLVLWRKESPLHITVQATDQIGDLQISTWPTTLSLVLTGPAVPITEFQIWLKKTNPATARFQPASRADDHNFGLLVKSLRENRCYVTASWEIEGKGHPTANLLFVPFAQDILCAAFPASGIPYLPTRQLPQEKAHHKIAEPRVPSSQKRPQQKPKNKLKPYGHAPSNNSQGSVKRPHAGRTSVNMTPRPCPPRKQLNGLSQPTRQDASMYIDPSLDLRSESSPSPSQ